MNFWKIRVELTVVLKKEQGKENLHLSCVNQVLLIFGQQVRPII